MTLRWVRLKSALADLAKSALSLYWDLLKTMVPVMIVVQIGVTFGLIDQLAQVFEPLMSLVGLPASTGLVWATGILVNNYGAAAALMGILPTTELTVAQLTVLLSMVLIAHALPLEQAISRKAGISFVFSSTLRFGGALVYGAILNAIYTWGEWLQHPATIAWLPQDGGQLPTWDTWALNSAVSLFWLFWIILALVTLLKVFEILKITDLLARLLSPLLGMMGISPAATSITMVGTLLGLSFGGGLIIKEARAGNLSPRDIVLSLSFMALCHSLIEDPLFMMALGGDVTGVLIGRFVFAVVVMVALSRMILALPDAPFRRLLYRGA
ncbi:nucleoside recognition domain-containing protein [Magnetovibrio sp.]|uniref:nucleoside recognition domain-containing protein n=1 Tax=Magnetovibrio sp. TaxID=2024836 RepID=UPI002F927390